MRLGAWAWLLCLAVACEGSEGVVTKDLVPYSSTRAPSRSPRAVCFQNITISPPENDISWEVGKEVQDVWCSVYGEDNTSTSQNLLFYKDTALLQHQIVNSTTIRTTLNLTQPEKFKLTCTDQNDSVCMATVKIGYEPLDVENLTCISHNWQSFFCTWKLPNNPVQDENNEYVPYLLSTLEPFPSERNLCGCPDPYSPLDDTCSCKSTCCLWTGESYYNTDPVLQVLFKAENALGAENFTYTVNNYAVVVPAAMSSVSVAVLAGRRQAVVSWTLPWPMGTFAESAAGVVVQVDHRLAEGVDSPLLPAPSPSPSPAEVAAATGAWIMGEQLPCHNSTCKTGQHTISLEFWWSLFEVRVRLRSAAAEEDGWWSDYELHSMTTPASAPDSPPAVGPGAFKVTQRGTGLCDVTLVWQQLPPLLHNGPDFGYLVQLCRATPGDQDEDQDQDQDQCEKVVPQVAVSESYAVFRSVSSAAPYSLRVAARNSEGRSSAWSAVGVRLDRPALPVLPVVVQHARPGQDALYELRWSPGQTPRHTVYACTGAQEGPNPCTGQLAWTTVVNVSAVNVTLRALGLQGEAEQVSFALSSEDMDGASSGLAWDRCVSPQPFTTARDPPKLRDAPLAGSSWVEVSWSLDCQSWAGVVEATEAAYCPGKHSYPSNCTAGQVSVGGDAWQEPFTLNGLDSDTQYTAWLKIQYRSGLSQWSDGVTFTTSTPGVAAWLIAVVVTVALVCTVAILLVLIYSKRKFVDNLKKLRLQPSLPSGLVPEQRQQDSQGDGGGGGDGSSRGEGDGGTDGIPVSENTVSAFVRSPGYSHILPTLFGRRPSLTVEEERGSEVGGRGVAQGGTVAPSAHEHGAETDDNAHNTAAERAAIDEANQLSSYASSFTSEPLLQQWAPSYVAPYFSESESETHDAGPSQPLFPSSQALLGGGSPVGGGGGGGGYIPPSECHKLSGASGYVSVQHGDHSGATGPGYVQADAVPHPAFPPDAAQARNSPAEGHRYVGLDLPAVWGDPARPHDPPHPTHQPVTPASLTPHPPAPRHDPGVPSLISMSLRGDERNAVPQEQGKPSYVALPDDHLGMQRLQGDQQASAGDNKPSYVTLPETQLGMQWQETDQQASAGDNKPSYVSLPDAQHSMKWQEADHVTPSNGKSSSVSLSDAQLSGGHATAGDGKVCSKESERQEKPSCPPSTTPAPGYIAVQPPDFGKPAEESRHLMTEDLECKPHLPDADFMSEILAKAQLSLAAAHTAAPAAFPAVNLAALEVPNVAHKPDVPGTSDVPSEAQEYCNLLSSAAEVGGYVPLPELETHDKPNSSTTRSSWLTSLLPSAPPTTPMPTHHPSTGITFVMLTNLFSKADKSDESDVKESEMNARSDTDERAENEDNEAAENENQALFNLPEGYSRVGDEE